MMEDVGEMGELSQEEILRRVTKSIVRVGENQGVKYQEAFVEMKQIRVEDGEIGCALVAAPYFAIARGAVPESGVLGLAKLTLGEWERIIYNEEESCCLPLTIALLQV